MKKQRDAYSLMTWLMDTKATSENLGKLQRRFAAMGRSAKKSLRMRHKALYLQACPKPRPLNWATQRLQRRTARINWQEEDMKALPLDTYVEKSMVWLKRMSYMEKQAKKQSKREKRLLRRRIKRKLND